MTPAELRAEHLPQAVLICFIVLNFTFCLLHFDFLCPYGLQNYLQPFGVGDDKKMPLDGGCGFGKLGVN